MAMKAARLVKPVRGSVIAAAKASRSSRRRSSIERATQIAPRAWSGPSVTGSIRSSNHSRAPPALRSASFGIPKGTITALVGVNGAGKSTLFKALMGFVTVAKGDIRVLGMSIKDALKRNLVAYVPQAEEVDWSFPVLVEDVVMMGRYGHMGLLRRPSATDRAKVDEALARVGLTDLRHRQIGELSGGQKKRVFLARALAQEGRIILLDEPFTGVDVKTEAEVVFEQLPAGRAATTDYTGYATGLESERQAVRAWALVNGVSTRDRAYEEYLVPVPQMMSEDAKFKVYWPVK